MKFVILQLVNVILLLLLQILVALENCQYSRMEILHMIGAYCFSKWDKLVRKRELVQIKRMLRKPVFIGEEKKEQKTSGLRWLVKKLQLVAGRKPPQKRGFLHNKTITKESFMKLLAKISLLVSPKQNSPNYKLRFCKHLIRLLILTSVHLERACEVTIFIF